MESGDEHIIEAIGRTRVVVRNGKVVEVGTPCIEACPLAERFACPVSTVTPDAVKENIEERIRSFGLCRPDRDVTYDRDFVMFGASELLSCGLKRESIECAVVVCDGAGSVIARSASLVQGIGGRMSGLIKTSPHPQVIERIEANGGTVVFPKEAKIDQVNAVIRAYAAGYSRVAVTIASSDDAERVRRLFPDSLIIGVHLTGVSPKDAERLAASCDIVSACASGCIREIAGKKALLQAGVTIPVYALTPQGKNLVLEKLHESSQKVLVRSARLPYTGEKGPHPLI